MTWFAILAEILKALISGELQNWLKQRREDKVTQAVANAPTTKDELDARLKDHQF